MAELNHIDYSLTAEPIVNIAVSCPLSFGRNGVMDGKCSETSIGVEPVREAVHHKKRVRTCKYITAEQKAEQRVKRLTYNKQYYREITLENKPLVTEISEEEKAKRKEQQRLKRQEYNKKYFQENKEKCKEANKTAWKKRKQYLYELARTPEIVELYNKLQAEKGHVGTGDMALST